MLNNVYGRQNERLTEHWVEMIRTTLLAAFEKASAVGLGSCGFQVIFLSSLDVCLTYFVLLVFLAGPQIQTGILAWVLPHKVKTCRSRLAWLT